MIKSESPHPSPPASPISPMSIPAAAVSAQKIISLLKKTYTYSLSDGLQKHDDVFQIHKD